MSGGEWTCNTAKKGECHNFLSDLNGWNKYWDGDTDKCVIDRDNAPICGYNMLGGTNGNNTHRVKILDGKYVCGFIT